MHRHALARLPIPLAPPRRAGRGGRRAHRIATVLPASFLTMLGVVAWFVAVDDAFADGRQHPESITAAGIDFLRTLHEEDPPRSGSAAAVSTTAFASRPAPVRSRAGSPPAAVLTGG